MQADFRTEVLGRPLRGNLGVRYVETDQTSSGFTFTSGAPVLTTVNRTYSDTLPSLNLVMEVTDSFLIRAAAAKVMARPNGGGQTTGLGILAPGAAVSIAGANKTVNAGNPELNPYRAKAYDLAFEWYFAKDSLLSLALFHKDIGSFVQIVRATRQLLQQHARPAGQRCARQRAAPTVPAATCLDGWQFNLPTNTDGGDVKGFEISYQQPFSFLPGFFSHFGVILNYTGVESEIEYFAPPVIVGGVPLPQGTVKEDLTGLSKSAYNATLYWENESLRRARLGSVSRRLPDDRAGTQQQRCRRHHRDAEPRLLGDVDGDAGSRHHARGAEPDRRVPGSVRRLGRAIGCRTTTTRAASTCSAPATSSEPPNRVRRPVCSRQTRRAASFIEGLIVRTPIILMGAACLLAGVAAHAQQSTRSRARDAASGERLGCQRQRRDRRIGRSRRADLHGDEPRGADRGAQQRRVFADLAVESVERAEDHLREGHDRCERRRREPAARVHRLLPQRLHDRAIPRDVRSGCVGPQSRRPAPSKLRASLRNRRSRRACASARARTPRSSVSAATRPSAARGSTSAALPAWRTAASNIIVRNITFQDTFDCFPAWAPTDGALGSWNSQYDSISLRDTNNVWIDHNTFEDRTTADSTLPLHFGVLFQVHDGLVDITNASDLVTVSWNRFRNHDKMMLIGSSDTAAADRGKLRVTLHHNLFDGIGQRAPRVRFGQVHVYNNLYDLRSTPNYVYSWGVGIESAMFAEENFFIAERAFTVDQIIERFNGTAASVSGTLVIGPRVRNPVDVVAAWNAVNDPDLGFDAGWTPTLNHELLPAWTTPLLVPLFAGPFR